MVGAVALAYLVLRTSPSLAAGAFSDDGVYLALGKALADGQGYHSVYAVGAPVHVKYPPGLPAVHAAMWALLGSLVRVHAVALLVSMLVTAAAAGLLWWTGRTRLGLAPLPLAVLGIGAFLLEGSVQYFNLAISEPWFLLGWAGSLVLYGRWAAGEGGARLLVLLGASLALTTLFRTQAVLLIPALALAILIHRRRLQDLIPFGAAAVVPIAAWALWHRVQQARGPLSTQPDEATYVSWAPEGGATAFVLDILGSQVTRYGAVMPAHLSAWTWLGAILALAVALLAALGAVRSARRAPDLVASVLAMCAVILLWPYSQDRFLFAILPFAALLAARGLQDLTGGRGPILALVLAALAVPVAVRQMGIRDLATAERTRDTFYFHPAQFLPDNSRFIAEASRWVAGNTTPDARLLTPLPSGLWLYTGRAGVSSTPAEPDVGPSVFDEPGRFLAQRVLEDDVQVLVLWNPNYLINRDGAEVQSACPDALEFLRMTPAPTSVVFFRIHPQDPCFQTRFLEPAAAS